MFVCANAKEAVGILLIGAGTAFLALSLVEAGYEVFANTDASGTFNDKIAADANRRMENAGVTLMGMFAIAMDLMRDWYLHLDIYAIKLATNPL